MAINTANAQIRLNTSEGPKKRPVRMKPCGRAVGTVRHRRNFRTERAMPAICSARMPNTTRGAKADLHLYDNAGHAFHWECMDDFNPRTTEWLLKH